MPRLLVVDDDPALLYSLDEYLTHTGYTVDAAASGPEALEALVRDEPDLIVSDILMDEMDGLELQRRVQGLTGGRIPFVFLTAKGTLSDRLAGLRAGADDYVVKPFEPDELEARIGAVLARVEQTRQEERRNARQIRGRALADASERLESPMTAMVEELDRLRAEVTGRGAPREQLERVLESAGTLETLVSDLSLAAEGTTHAPPLRKKPQRIAPLVRAAAANAARLAAERSVGLQIACGGLLSGNVDGPALQRALGALLEAVVALSPENGAVRIQAHRAPEGGLEIAIAECGAADRDAPPADGLGGRLPAGAPPALEVARRVVGAHGGRLELSDEPVGRPSLVVWLPGRVARHVGRKG